MENEKSDKISTEEVVGGDEEKWVYDSSFDHKGRPPLRASTGVWKAALFIIAIEFAERLSYFGLATNLIIYLTKVLHQELKTAAKNVNFWSGVTTMMPLVGGFVADAHLGRFTTILLASLIYLLGLGLLTMSRLVPSLKPDRSLRTHEIVFFVAMYLISSGTGGHKPALQSFGADQFDDDHPGERRKKLSYFNWWNCGLCSGVLMGVTLIVYIQDNVSWVSADILLTIVMAISLMIFVAGTRFYRHRAAAGSPLTPMLRVLVAAVAKRRCSYPSDVAELYEVPRSEKSTKRLLCHTHKLRFLDKAAIIEHKHEEAAFAAEKETVWRLATVTQVEEVKLVLLMVPIWLTSLPFGMCVAQSTTFFIKQGSIMNRRLVGRFEIPPASIFAFAAIGMIVSLFIYDKILVPLLRRATGNERGMTILQRMGVGMVFSVAAIATAAAVERRRLNVAEAEQTSVVSMSVFWLVPQFMLLGLADGFTLVGLQEYFYDQVPDNMRSLGIAFYLSVIGVANFLSSLLITVVDRFTSRGGRTSWFAKDLNKSRLDYYYWLLVAINGVNICIFAYLASRYNYKKVQRKVGIAICSERDNEVDSRIP